MLTILKVPNPRLTQPNANLDLPPKDIANAMIKIMNEAGGIGLAANQVGLDYRCFAMKTKRWGDIVICNPNIVQESKTLVNSTEGCLSCPTRHVLHRHDWITIQGIVGDKLERMSFSGTESFCVQHEIDHLNGILIISRGLPL